MSWDEMGRASAVDKVDVQLLGTCRNPPNDLRNHLHPRHIATRIAMHGRHLVVAWCL